MTLDEAQGILNKITLPRGPVKLIELTVYGGVNWVDPIGRTDAIRAVIMATDVNPPHKPMDVFSSWPILSLEHLTKRDLLASVRYLLLDLATHELDEAFTYDGERIYDPHKGAHMTEDEALAKRDVPSPAYHTTACPLEHEPAFNDETKHHERCEWRQCGVEERAWHDHIVWKLKNDFPCVFELAGRLLK